MTPSPMKLLRPDGDKNNYVRIPTALFALNLPAAQERLWIRLASLERGDFTEDFPNLDSLADATGITRSSFYRILKDMRKLGLVKAQDDDLLLLLPNSVELPQKEAKPVIESIAEEVAAEPRRQNTMKAKDAQTAVIEAWNQYKPETYITEGKSMNPGVWIAFETQAKRLKVNREDYVEFVKSICRGLKADEWWADKSLKLTNVVGFSANLEDKKFQTVEKLYKTGQTRQAKSAAFSGSDRDFLDWYNAKGFAVQKIERHEVEHINDAREKERAIIEAMGETVDRSVARVYFRGNVATYWSGKDSQPKLYNLP